MLAADIPIAVTVPEPPAIETTYRFLRAAFRRRLRRVARARPAAVGDPRARADASSARCPRPSTSCTSSRKMDTHARRARVGRGAARCACSSSSTRRACAPTPSSGRWMSGLVSRHYGVALDELGHVEHDDTVWLDRAAQQAAARRQPDEQERAQHRAHRAARRSPWRRPSRRRARAAAADARPRSRRSTPCSASRARRATRRSAARTSGSARSTPRGGLATVVAPRRATSSRRAQRKLDEAYDTLLDPVRRRAYDLSTFPEPEPEVLSARATRPALAAEQLMLQEELAARDRPRHRVHRRAPAQGARVAGHRARRHQRRRRRSRRAHLQAIEEERFDDLPALVYMRGFLVELAKYLRLDPPQVQRTYLRRHARGARRRAARSSRERARDRARERRRLFGALLFVVALVPRASASRSRGRASRCGTGTTTTSARGASPRGSATPTTSRVAGHLVWHPWCHYPVGYSAFLALFYRVLGASHAVAAVANALVGAALAVVTWALARHALSRARARVAGLIVALHPGLDPLRGARDDRAARGAAHARSRSGWPCATRGRGEGSSLGALVLGVAALVRPQALLCAPFLALVLIDAGARRRGCAAAAARRASRAPCARAGAPVDGAQLPRDGRLRPRQHQRRLEPRHRRLPARDRPLRDAALERRLPRGHRAGAAGPLLARTTASRRSSAHPWHWLALVPAKLGYTFDHESFAVEYLHEARPEAWPEARRAPGARRDDARAPPAARGGGARAASRSRAARQASRRGRPGRRCSSSRASSSPSRSRRTTPTFWPLAVFVAVVPWLPLPGRPPMPPALLLPVALLATTLVTHAVFFGEDRYHVVVTPVLALLAAGALRPREAVPT